MLFDPESGTSETGDSELLETWRGSGKVLWVDLQDELASTEYQFLETHFGIHPMAIQDAQRERHPPKYEDFGTYYFLLLKGLSPTATPVVFDTIQIALFVGQDFFITRHAFESRSVNSLWESIQVDAGLIRKGVKALPAQLGRNIVNRYLHLLFEIEDDLGDLEQELLSDDPSDDQLTKLALYKTRLRKMSRTFTYHEQVFDFLRSNPHTTDNHQVTHEFNDTYEQMERVASLSSLYYDLASDLINSSISLASHRLNGIMKVLTIVMAIFVPLSFLAGIYGMNFEHMPELGFEGAYFMLLSLMGLLALTLLGIFKYKRWL